MQLIKVVPRVSSSFLDGETLFVLLKKANEKSVRIKQINEKEEYNFFAVLQRAGDGENPVYTEIGMDLRECPGNNSIGQRLISVNG